MVPEPHDYSQTEFDLGGEEEDTTELADVGSGTEDPAIGKGREGVTPPRRFLGWEEALPDLVAAQLLDEHGRESGTGPIDLRGWMVVVPTGGAARGLRRALVGAAVAGGTSGGLIPPQVVPPSALLSKMAAGRQVASATQCVGAWVEVLRKVRAADFPALFPAGAELGRAAAALSMAESFVSLGRTLGEAGLWFRGVRERLGDAPEGEVRRWDDLAELENRYLRALRERGLDDPDRARSADRLGEEGAIPAGVNKIVLAGLPDPAPLLTRALSLCGRPVEVWIAAPETLAPTFDDWGRPDREAWRPGGTAPWPALESDQIHLLSTGADQAAAAAKCCEEANAAAVDNPAVVVCNPAITPEVAIAFGDREIEVFDPAGGAWSEGRAFALVSAWVPVVRSGGFDAACAAARGLDLLGRLAQGGGLPDRVLEMLDWLRSDRFPTTIEAAHKIVEKELEGGAGPFTSPYESRLKGLAAVLRSLRELRRPFTQSAPGSVGKALEAFIDEVFPDGAAEEGGGGNDGEFLGALSAAVGELEDGGFSVGEAGAESAAATLELALDALAEGRSFSRAPEGSVSLNGWLELLWERRSHALVLGANEGSLPSAVVGDAFLPDAARAAVGLRTNADRFARDRYVLHAAGAWRAGEGGRLDLLLGRTESSGDPLVPSRLLFLVPDADLPTRARQLFGLPEEVDAAGGDPGQAAPTLAWKLGVGLPKPKAEPGGEAVGYCPVEQLSPTRMRDYLACPFVFYLKHVLKMRAMRPPVPEMDPLQFGILVHEVLRAFCEDEAAGDLREAADIAKYFEEELSRQSVLAFGEDPPLLVRVQLLSALDRLRAAAEVEAVERAAGWRTIATEQSLGEAGDWKIGGMIMTGQLDRLDRNEETGELRVVDYKTGAKGEDPGVKHWTTKLKKEIPPEDLWMLHDGRLWKDLQLPLYAARIAEEHGVGIAEVRAGYFNLPLAASDAQLSMWTKMTPEVVEDAVRCAGEVVERVLAGEFWPPRDKAQGMRELEHIFLDNAPESVDGEAFVEALAAGWTSTPRPGRRARPSAGEDEAEDVDDLGDDDPDDDERELVDPDFK